MARIVWSKRLLKLLIVALVVATVSVALGIWQIARLHQRRQFNAAVRAGLAAAPQPVHTLVPDRVDPGSVRYRRAFAAGTYDASRGFVLYGRTQDSQPGNHLLTPLVMGDGHAILVDRGWVPLDVDRPDAEVSAPPAGRVRVTGVLFASEGDPPGPVGTADATETTLARLDLARIQSQLPYRILPVYLLLQRQAPSQPSLPVPAPLPELSEGPHLGYAIQWFSFATIALVGLALLAFREGRDAPATPDGRPAV